MIVVLDFPTQAKKKSVAICDLHKIWQNFRDYAGDQTSAFTLFTMLIGPRQEYHQKVSIVAKKLPKSFQYLIP